MGLFSEELIYGGEPIFGVLQYDIFISIFRTVLDKHAPLKMKKLRGNQVKFMTKELRKS